MSDPRDEALLYVEWMRGAAGRLLPADAPAPPVARGGAASRPEALPAVPTSPLAAPPSTEALPGASPGGASTDPAEGLALLAREVATCVRCGLAATRTTTVFGEGSPRPLLVAVGEAPGAEEDRTGRPFVGRAGELLTRMLAAIGLPREAVFICNVLKCRPPGNREPRPDEVAACRPYLKDQLTRLGPPLLLALGAHAARLLLGRDVGISEVRGRIQASPEGWRVMPTYHPAYLLRNPSAKREAWEDLKKVAADLGLPIPSR